MRVLTFAQVAQIFGQKRKHRIKISRVIIDSREAVANCLFFALPGSKTDGHHYVNDVLNRGGFAVVKKGFGSGDRILEVENPLQALQELAAQYLAAKELPVVAVTGSNGKTTTKDLIAAVLSSQFSVHKTYENYNNEIGVPLTILGLQEQHQVLVVEMGMRGEGQIEALTNIAPPDIAVITNIHPVHLELLGSIQNISAAKSEILTGLKPEGIAVLNGDDQLVRSVGKKARRKVFYGFEPNNDLRASRLEYDNYGRMQFDCHWQHQIYAAVINIPGKHNVSNSLAALAVGMQFGVSLSDGIASLRNSKLSKMRLEIISGVNEITIVNDAYNASPASMRAALDIVKELETKGKKIVILGDMLELGDLSERSHQSIGGYAAAVSDMIIAVGNYAHHYQQGAKKAGFPNNSIKIYSSVELLIEDIHRYIKKQDLVLVKASRALQLERVVEAVREAGEKL